MGLFKTQLQDEVNTIVCPEEIGAEAEKELPALVKEWEAIPVSLHILDMKAVSVISRVTYRHFILFHQSLKRQKKFLMSTNFKKELVLQINEDGLSSIFNPQITPQEARKKAGMKSKAQSQLNVEFLNPFIKATQMTLEMQANTPLQAGKPFVIKAEDSFQIEVAGVINLTSDQFNGAISICFPKKVFLKIYSNMLGEEHSEINDEIYDAAGELLNIIFGQAKAELNDKKGYTILKAIPTVLYGEKLKVHHTGRNPAIAIPFTTDAGVFRLEISTDPA